VEIKNEYQLMRDTWIVADSIVSPLGLSSEANYLAIQKKISAIAPVMQSRLGKSSVFAAQITDLKSSERFTRFEVLCAEALERVLKNTPLQKEKTLFILSTTKGNIALLENGKSDHDRIHLHQTAKHLADVFGLPHYRVISNACISGVMAILVAKRYLESGMYEHAVVLGADELSEFIISGFQSLSALSPEPCKPFDADRKGVNLGECAAALIITASPEKLGKAADIKVSGGGLSNDANHISGPSRTGNELAYAITSALREANTTITDIDFISAHGTATLYNDEMEAKAFYGIGMKDVPVISMKGSFGHTLGAAGILETILSVHSLQNNEILPTTGFENHGVTESITVNKSLLSKPLSACIKTASGFGGCNAALVLKKK
jgi:3-oxoacyl-[acyl-carrier-protein] synthase-1